MTYHSLTLSARRAGAALAGLFRQGASQQRQYILDADQGFFLAQCLVQVLALAVLYLLFNHGHTERHETLVYLAFLLTTPAVAFLCHRATRRLPTWTACNRAHHALGVLAVAALPLVIIGAGSVGLLRVLYFSYEASPPLLPFSQFRLVSGGAVAALLYAAALRQRIQRRDAPPGVGHYLCYVAGLVLIVGLFDGYLMIDTLSYSPYLAPALGVSNGLVPLIDVFSQYGLGYLLFAAGFSVQHNLFLPAALVAGLNVVMYLAVARSAFKLGADRLLSFILMVFAILFAHSAQLYNVNYTPSVLAMRFLPPTLLVLALLHAPVRRPFSVLSGAAAVLCSFWSLEALVFGLAAYTAYLALCSVALRTRTADVVRAGLRLAALFILPHVALSAAYLAIFATLPRYDIYLALVFANLNGGEYWSMLMEPGVRTWILFAFGYASALGLAMHRALAARCLDEERTRRCAGIGAVAVLGALELSYYVGRSATPLLPFLSLPLLLFVVLAGDWAVAALRRDGAVPLLAWPVLTLAAVAFTAMGGIAADRFFRPISRDLSNSSLLRAGLALDNREACDPCRLFNQVTSSAGMLWTYPENETGGSLTYTHPRNRAAYDLVRAYTAQNRRVLLFLADPVPVIFYTPAHAAAGIIYPPHRIGVAYPAVDGLAPVLAQRARATLLADLRAGDIVIRDDLPTYPLDNAVLADIKKAWALRAVSSTDADAHFHVRAYELQSFDSNPGK